MWAKADKGDLIWGRELCDESDARRKKMEDLWEHAEKISISSGVEFRNRAGELTNAINKQCVVEEAVKLYLKDHMADWGWL